MFEAQRLVVRVGGVDGSNDDPPLMADILPRDTSTFVGTFTMSDAYKIFVLRSFFLLARRFLSLRTKSDSTLR